MSFEQDLEAAQFAFRFLEGKGAVLEKSGGGSEALLPKELSKLLGVPEYISISDRAASESEDHYSTSFGSPLLEKMVEAVCSQLPVVACQLKFDYLKTQGFDRLISGQFSFHKTIGKVSSSGIIMTNYLLLICRYVAQSDEQKQGLIELVLSYETGALIPRMQEMLSIPAKEFTVREQPAWDKGKLEKIAERTKSHAEGILKEELLPFKESMNRRFKRDANNLEEYYESLRKEMEKSLERPGLLPDQIKDRKDKIALLPGELARKRDDLFKKYSIKVNVTPCAAMFIATPAIKILYRVSMGKQQTTHSLIYNPVTRLIDPLVCQGCGRGITNIYFCDHFHALCSRCSDRCPLC